MAIAAVLAITLDPAMRLCSPASTASPQPTWLRRVANAVLVGTIHSEETHPISRPLIGSIIPRWSSSFASDG